jgi:hypothetical protein
MSGLQRVDAGQPNIASTVVDLLSRKSLLLAHPDEVVDDQELTLADKRSLLASWASDALAVKDSPSLRQLASGAVVRVDAVMTALKSVDLYEPDHKSSATFPQPFARRGAKPTPKWRNLRPEIDDEPPPCAASARIPTPQKNLIACGSRYGHFMGDSDWLKTRGWKPARVPGARSMASIPTNPLWKRVA